jgi:sortase A
MKRLYPVLLILLSWVVAACGSTAQAKEPALQVERAGGYTVIQVDSPPVAPLKAPRFHRPAALRVLPERLEVPAIKLDIPVVELGWSTKKNTEGQVFSEWDVADFAAGWHKNSALPGAAGNVVMSGHNNIKGAVFRQLDRLKRGDEVIVYAGNEPYTYAVDEVLILPEKYAALEQRKANAAYIKPTTDDRLTLVSCWPRNDNTHRIVVIARPVDPPSIP